MNRLKVKPADWILLAAIIAAGILIFILFFTKDRGEGAYVEVRVDGKVTAAVPLSESGSYEAGGNRFEIRDGKISMTEAGCPDGLCLRMDPISKTGESILCLPNRVSLRIVSGEGDGSAPEIDAVAE